MFCRSTRQRGSSSNFLLWMMWVPRWSNLLKSYWLKPQDVSRLYRCASAPIPREMFTRLLVPDEECDAVDQNLKLFRKPIGLEWDRQTPCGSGGSSWVLYISTSSQYFFVSWYTVLYCIFFSSNLSWQPKLAKEILLELNCTCSTGWANTILKLKAFSRL